MVDASDPGFERQLEETFYVMIFFNLLFTGVIACGVVYNAARVSRSERSRELASLRVLGFTRGEISFILLGELASVTLMAIPVGMLMGYIFAGLLVAALEPPVERTVLVAGAVEWVVYDGKRYPLSTHEFGDGTF